MPDSPIRTVLRGNKGNLISIVVRDRLPTHNLSSRFIKGQKVTESGSQRERERERVEQERSFAVAKLCKYCSVINASYWSKHRQPAPMANIYRTTLRSNCLIDECQLGYTCFVRSPRNFERHFIGSRTFFEFPREEEPPPSPLGNDISKRSDKLDPRQLKSPPFDPN